MQAAVGPDNKAAEADEKLVELGRMLFYDNRLSGRATHSCNSCHDLTKYGTNGDYFLQSKEQGESFRDVPSLYNLKNQEMFGWDGAHKKMTEKISHSLGSRHEMNVENVEALITRLQAIAGYQAQFERCFPDEANAINTNNISIALEAFIAGLITPAPIDKFLAGDDQALTEKQLKGVVAFERNTCFACHTSSLVGGQLIMKLGVVEAWPNQLDKGLYDVSKDPEHLFAFRVASLRNAEKTAPYFHDHSSNRLWDAIGKMGRYELGKRMALEDIAHIQEFIKSLTGEIPLEYIKKPELPE